MAFLYRTMGEWVIRPLMSTLYRAEIGGGERIPVGGPAILASNHESLVDPFVLSLATPRVVHYMAKVELFENRFLRPFMEGFGTFPIERGRGDRAAMARGRAILDDGGIIGMFPQGTAQPFRQRPYRRGAARLALETGAPIVPVCLVGTERILRPHRFRVGLPRVHVLVARPIQVEPRKPTIVAANALIAEVEATIEELHEPYGEPEHVWVD